MLTFQSRTILDNEKPIRTSFMHRLNTMSMMTLCKGFEKGAFEVHLSGLKFSSLFHLVQFILVSVTEASVS